MPTRFKSVSTIVGTEGDQPRMNREQTDDTSCSSSQPTALRRRAPGDSYESSNRQQQQCRCLSQTVSTDQNYMDSAV